jgi:hypothetical protein
MDVEDNIQKDNCLNRCIKDTLERASELNFLSKPDCVCVCVSLATRKEDRGRRTNIMNEVLVSLIVGTEQIQLKV